MPNDQTALKLEGGDLYTPKDTDVVRCEEHDVVARWGDLSAIQRLAVEEGIDTVADLPCILVPENLIDG